MKKNCGNCFWYESCPVFDSTCDNDLSPHFCEVRDKDDSCSEWESEDEYDWD